MEATARFAIATAGPTAQIWRHTAACGRRERPVSRVPTLQAGTSSCDKAAPSSGVIFFLPPAARGRHTSDRKILPDSHHGHDARHEHQTAHGKATNVTDVPTPDATADKPTQPSDATRVERNKAASRRWIEVFNERDDAAEADVRAEDFVGHAPVSLEPAPLDSEAWTRFLSDFVKGFPDLHLTVEEAVGEGNFTAQMIRFEGTHTGEFQGLPPTHKKVTFSGLELNRFVDGRVSIGSNWTHSRCSSSWVWSSCQARGCCRGYWPTM
jgi:predicted ester cyclase